jgi:hypothetical protein
MRAFEGDWIVVESPQRGLTRRKGLVVGVRHSDGSPPYLVRWTDDDRESLVFPGPDAHVVHHRPHEHLQESSS